MPLKYLTEKTFDEFRANEFVPMREKVDYIATEIKTLQVNLQTVNGRARNKSEKNAYEQGKIEGRWKLMSILIPCSIVAGCTIIGFLL